MSLNAGLYADVPMGDYIADPAPDPSLSKGAIRDLVSLSPAHARINHPRLNPDRPRDDSSRADIGSAIHSMILGGADIVFAPEEFTDWRKKDAKAWRDEQRADGNTPLLHKQEAPILDASHAAKVFLADQGFGVDDGQTEGTMIWQKGDIWKRGRFDLWLPKKKYMIDVKTCEVASPQAWMRQSLASMGYDIQAEHYLEGIKAVGDADHADFLFLLVEITPPYSCSFVGLAEAYVHVARRKIAMAEELWARCLETDTWPGINPGPHWAEPPPWVLADLETQTVVMEQKGVSDENR